MMMVFVLTFKIIIVWRTGFYLRLTGILCETLGCDLLFLPSKYSIFFYFYFSELKITVNLVGFSGSLLSASFAG